MSQSTPLQRVTVLGALQKQNFQGNATRAGVERGCRDLVAWWGSSFGSFRGITDANTGEARSKLTGDDDLHAGFALGGGVKVRPGDTGWLGVDSAWRPVRLGLFEDIIEVGIKLNF